jgi:hypothetical protein
MHNGENSAMDSGVGVVRSHQRRSDRVAIAIQIEIAGTDLMGSDFAETAKTESVNRFGASIVTKASLGPDQQVYLRRAGNRAEALARVIGQIGVKDGMNVYGVVLENTGHAFWGINFPIPEEEQPPTVRMLLECNACQTREVVYLGELELDVFNASGSMSRACNTCRQWSLWKQTQHEVVDGPLSAPEAAAAAEPQKRPNRRKHVRMEMRMMACIKYPGRPQEVVNTADISRGGMRFYSKTGYPKGAWIEVAMPYTPSAANIFVAGRIVHAEKSQKPGFNDYGVEYVKNR